MLGVPEQALGGPSFGIAVEDKLSSGPPPVVSGIIVLVWGQGACQWYCGCFVPHIGWKHLSVRYWVGFP